MNFWETLKSYLPGGNGGQKQTSGQATSSSGDRPEKRISAYFAPFVRGNTKGIVVGVVVAFFLHLFAGQFWLTGLGALLAFLACSPKKASEQEIDQFVQSTGAQLLQNGYAACHLDPDSVALVPPIVAVHYLYRDHLNETVQVRRGKDGQLRAQLCQIYCLYFSENQLFVYSTELSLLSGNSRSQVSEYYYDNILSFGEDTVEQTVSYAKNKSARIEVKRIQMQLATGPIVIPYISQDPDMENKIGAAINMIRMWRRSR